MLMRALDCESDRLDQVNRALARIKVRLALIKN